MLGEAANLLEKQGASRFRVVAYRRAAQTVAKLENPVDELARIGGPKALDALPGIGPSIASAILEMVQTGHWRFLDLLCGSIAPQTVFRQIPGIGPELAQRIHEALDIDDLEDLELAAHDGRLETVPGIGSRRVSMVRNAVGALLRERHVSAKDGLEPEVAAILAVDAEYRSKGPTLPKIAPQRFNPTGEAWLPILHTERDGWQFTALYSNSARAHRFRKAHDWVVIFAHRGAVEVQRTVVTEHTGALKGRRVVRGREAECVVYYEGSKAPADAVRERSNTALTA
jgi:hypothetical protein